MSISGFENSVAVDYSFGIIHLTCFIVGIPGRWKVRPSILVFWEWGSLFHTYLLYFIWCDEDSKSLKRPISQLLTVVNFATKFFSHHILIAGNILLLRYFCTRHKDLPTFLYMISSSIDLTICSMVLFVAASFFNNRLPTMFTLSQVCYVWSFLFHVAQKMSVFVIGTLSCTRAISLVVPLYRVKKRTVLLIVFSYGVLQVLYEAILTGKVFHIF